MKTESIKNELKPLYQKLLDNNTFEEICTFCMQWGRNFPSTKEDGILVVGKAVNGWVTKETDMEILFNDFSNDKIFARNDQMEWVNNLEGNNEIYNTKKSAFWRVIKKVAQSQYPNEWFSHIAWSNLYKIAPFNGGNPGGSLRKSQFSICRDILKKEIDILSPKIIIFFTSGWECDFWTIFEGSEHIKQEIWGNDTYQKTNLFKANNTYIITTPHPQGKKESEHANVIIDFINQYK